MKSIRLALLLGLAAFVALAQVSAQNIVRQKKPFALPGQFIVKTEGIAFIMPGSSQVSSIPWADIDLAQLARAEPELESARQNALLTNSPTYFTILARPDYLHLFLLLPTIKTFKASWQLASNSRYATSGSSFPPPVGATGEVFVAPGSDVGRSIIYIDPVRYPLANTLDGLLQTISNDRNDESQRLVRSLQNEGTIFPNLVTSFKNLQALYPRDELLRVAIKALEKMTNDRSVSIDAQRDLAKFLNYAHGHP